MENSPLRTGAAVCAALESFYQIKNDTLAKEPYYLEALELLREHGLNLDEEEPAPADEERLQERLELATEELRTEQERLAQRQADGGDEPMRRVLEFDLNGLQHCAERVNRSVEHLNRNIEMMRSNRSDRGDDRPPLAVDEPLLVKANFLLENLVKIGSHQ